MQAPLLPTFEGLKKIRELGGRQVQRCVCGTRGEFATYLVAEMFIGTIEK